MTLKKVINYGIFILLTLALIASIALYIADYYDYGTIMIVTVDFLLVIYVLVRLIKMRERDKKLTMLMKSMEDDYRDITKSFDEE